MPTPRPKKMPTADELRDSLTIEEQAMFEAPPAPKTKAPAPEPAAEPEKPEARPVVYPFVQVVRCKEPTPGYEDSDAPPLTLEDVFTLVGWRTEEKGEKWGTDFMFLDPDGNKVRWDNNPDNRRFTKSWGERLGQDVARGNWRFNGESWIIGKTARLLSLQHRAAAVAFAQWAVTKNPDYYREWWPDGIVRVPALLVYGIEETEDVVGTLDNVKPRTFVDVLMTSKTFRNWAGFSETTTQAELAKLCAMLDSAVKLCWERTRAKKNVWVKFKTHTEALEWIHRHPRIVDAVMHVHSENGSGAIGDMVNQGLAAGLMYLMGAAATPNEGADNNQPSVNAYVHPGNVRREELLDMKLWERAEEFVTLLAADPKFKPVREKIARMKDAELGTPAAADEVLGVIAKAWRVYLADGGKFVANDPRIKIKHRPHDSDPDATVPDEWPTVGGVDFGEEDNPNEPEDVDQLIADVVDAIEGDEHAAVPEAPAKDRVTPDVIEAGKAAAKVKNGHAAAGTGGETGDEPADGGASIEEPPAPPKARAKPGGKRATPAAEAPEAGPAAKAAPDKPVKAPPPDLLSEADKAELEKLRGRLAAKAAPPVASDENAAKEKAKPKPGGKLGNPGAGAKSSGKKATPKPAGKKGG